MRTESRLTLNPSDPLLGLQLGEEEVSADSAPFRSEGVE